jgi:RNA polymerase sigma-70 factor, ECF subfamily
MQTWPSPVVALNRAAARSRLPNADLNAVQREIDELRPALAGYRYLPATRADILSRLLQTTRAAEAYDEALALTTNPVERRFLIRRRARLAPEPDAAASRTVSDVTPASVLIPPVSGL